MLCLARLIFRSLPDYICSSTTLREGPVSAICIANGVVPFVFQSGLVKKAWSLQIGFLSGVTEQEGAFQNHI